MPREQLVGQHLVARVDALAGNVFFFAMQQVTDIMQQSSGDQCIGAMHLSRKVGCLQAVFKHGHGFAKVGVSAAALQQAE